MALNFPQFFNNLFRPRLEGGDWFYISSQTGGTFNEIELLKAFEEIPEVNAVISTKAQYFSNGKFIVVNDKLEEQIDHPFNKLLRSPNWFQAGKEFLINTKLFHEIFGNEYIYQLKPFGLNNPMKLKALFTLPPHLVEPKYNDTTPFFLHSEKPNTVTYEYKSGSGTKVINGDLIIHLNDNRTCIHSMNDENLLRGESKLNALTAVVNNIRMAYESRGVILKSRGALGLLSPDGKDVAGPIPFQPEDIKELQSKFKRDYGTREGQSQIIISNKAARWVQMGVNEPEKLGLYKETEDGFLKIIDSFGMHPDVFATIKGATFENQRQSEKGIYVRTIIPDANEWCFAINQQFFSDSPLKVIADYSHLPIFQEDLKTKSEAIATKINYLSKLLMDKQITQDEYRAELLEIKIGDGKAIPVAPDENAVDIETRTAQAQLRGSVGGVQGILSIQQSVASGTTTPDAAIGILTVVYGFTPEQAVQILGKPKAQEAAQPGNEGQSEDEGELEDEVEDGADEEVGDEGEVEDEGDIEQDETDEN